MPAVHDLSIRQLEYVVAVADTLGFHRAAERCGVSQPSLSAQVHHIEEVLGVVLFERDKRRVLVTAAGQLIVERARRVLRELSDLVAAAARLADPLAGTVRIGVIPTVAPYLLPEVTQAWGREFPKLRVIWREGLTDVLLPQLEAGELDAVLLATVPGMEGLETAEVTVDPFLLALPKGHPLARRREVHLGDLDGLDVLLLDDGHCLRVQALALCSQARVTEADVRATSLSTLAQMVSGGAGVTLLPAMAVPVENRRSQLEVRPFAPPAPSRTIALAWRPTSPHATTFRALAAGVARAVAHSSASAPSLRASARHQALTSSKAPGVRR